jgi:hypothetical protein
LGLTTAWPADAARERLREKEKMEGGAGRFFPQTSERSEHPKPVLVAEKPSRLSNVAVPPHPALSPRRGRALAPFARGEVCGHNANRKGLETINRQLLAELRKTNAFYFRAVAESQHLRVLRLIAIRPLGPIPPHSLPAHPSPIADGSGALWNQTANFPFR